VDASAFETLADAQSFYDQNGMPVPPEIRAALLARQSQAGKSVGGITPGMILAHISMVRHGLQKEREAKDAKKAAKEQAQAPAQLTPFQQLMAMAQGGGSADGSLDSYLQALRQSRAQTSENQKDIGDWYGQLSQQVSAAGKANAKTSRKMRKEGKTFNRSLMGGQADKGVAYALGLGAVNEGSYLRELATDQRAFDRRLANDAVAQGNYQKMVQARLGAQERAGIRDDMRAAAAQSQGEGWDRMMSVLGLMSQEQRDAFLQGQDPRMAGSEAPDFNAMRDALAESADTMFRDIKDPATGDPSQVYTGGGGFPHALEALRGAATSSGIDLSDPRQREAFRAWVAGNFANRYSNYTDGPNWGLSPNGLQFNQL
jgi:hypothetical protein